MDGKEKNQHTSEERSLDDILNYNIDDILNEWAQMESREQAAEKAEEPAVIAEPVVKSEKRRKAKKDKKEKKNWQSTLLVYLHDLVYLLAGLILVFLLLFRVVVVSGTSMNDTLLDGDYLLLLSGAFYNDPKYGDVIVISKANFDNGAPIVKRVIATEGQWIGIDFQEGVVYVGNSADKLKPLDEPYTMTPTEVDEGFTHSPENPMQIPEGCMFVMGDNRNGSKDSRHPEIGLVDKREVLGKVCFLFLPGTNKNQEAQDFDRIGVVH